MQLCNDHNRSLINEENKESTDYLLRGGIMNRREFIKGAVITSAVLSSGSLNAAEYEHEDEKIINQLVDRENPSVLEQKHVPVIKIPRTIEAGAWFDVQVKVGFMREHPSTRGHWITSIKLLVDGKEITETGLKKGGITASFAAFKIRLDKGATLAAVAHCNLHGKWISGPVSVKVT